MNKIKLIFIQTLMVSTAILFGIGVQAVISHFVGGFEVMNWPWYIPLSIVLSGFLSSIPTTLILSLDTLSKRRMWFRIILHFILVGVIVSLCGLVFKWFDSLAGYIPIIGMYILIYVFVWAASGWMAKSDEKKINEAIKDFQDED